MHIFHSLRFSLPLTALATLIGMGPVVGCDTEDDLSPEDLALLAADLADEPDAEAMVDGEGRPDELTAEADVAAYTWLSWHSDETPGVSKCGLNQVVTGFDCNGSYCDDVKLQCHGFGTSVPNNGSWSPWFEHNGIGSYTCPAGQLITALDCSGDNCDNLSIRCTSSGLTTSNCGWTSNWYSEENPGALTASGEGGDVIRGIWCSGTHCDDKKFYVCEI